MCNKQDLGDDSAAVRRAERAIWEPLRPSNYHRTHGILAAPLEHREVHHLPDGDPSALLSCHQFPQDPTTDRPENILVGGGAQGPGGGYITYLRAVSIHHQWVGSPGAQVQDISQPVAPGKTVVGSSVYCRKGKGRGASDRGHVPQDRPACLVRTPLKASQGLPTVRAQPISLQTQAIGNGAGGHHRHDVGHSRTATVRVGGGRGEWTPSAYSSGL